jgi:hypothetical protein
VYLKSLIVFVLCTVFVLSFVVVLNYATAGVGKGGETMATSHASCSAAGSPCESFSITSAGLHTVNYTDELGVVNYATLVLGLNASGSSPITSVDLFIGNLSAGRIQGPFEPGVNRVVNLTLPATVSVSSGKTYLVNVEGFYGNGLAVWQSERVIAR